MKTRTSGFLYCGLLVIAALQLTACAGAKTKTSHDTEDELTPAAPQAKLEQDWPTDALTLHLMTLRKNSSGPMQQFLVHPYCHAISDDFAQCALFDGERENALLMGMEYRISAALFEKLPTAERADWRPINHEILAGLTQAPGFAREDETDVMREQLNHYAKAIYFPLTTSSDLGGSAPLGAPQPLLPLTEADQPDPTLVGKMETVSGAPIEDVRSARAALAQDAIALTEGTFSTANLETPSELSNPSE